MGSYADRIGLALSGGGFRACLYHLGLVRFLRDGGILPHITHITAVSGGSIFAAHLVLNWDRYTGSTEEFDKAASQLLDFVRPPSDAGAVTFSAAGGPRSRLSPFSARWFSVGLQLYSPPLLR